MDVTQSSKPSEACGHIPWWWFGAAKDDGTWYVLSDEIKLNREVRREEK
jgi:hypothetical protein